MTGFTKANEKFKGRGTVKESILTQMTALALTVAVVYPVLAGAPAWADSPREYADYQRRLEQSMDGVEARHGAVEPQTASTVKEINELTARISTLEQKLSELKDLEGIPVGQWLGREVVNWCPRPWTAALWQ
jgi:septal ring factor EnvC (AmiA/AmiB activator)